MSLFGENAVVIICPCYQEYKVRLPRHYRKHDQLLYTKVRFFLYRSASYTFFCLNLLEMQLYECYIKLQLTMFVHLPSKQKEHDSSLD